MFMNTVVLMSRFGRWRMFIILITVLMNVNDNYDSNTKHSSALLIRSMAHKHSNVKVQVFVFQCLVCGVLLYVCIGATLLMLLTSLQPPVYLSSACLNHHTLISHSASSLITLSSGSLTPVNSHLNHLTLGHTPSLSTYTCSVLADCFTSHW